MKRLAFAGLVLGVTVGGVAQPSQESLPQQLDQPPRTSSEAVPVAYTGDSDPMDFKTLDTNGDGRVNRAEAVVIEGFDFSSADTNDDGSLSRPEYQAARATVTPKDDVAHERRTGRTDPVSFETADKNKDGRINRTEASDIPGLDFSAADTNEDASLTRQEYRVALTGSLSRG